jgi:DNA-binding NarL/FixJ family response regulator
MAASEVTPPTKPDIRVLLVDDQPQFRRAAAMLIQTTDGLALAGEAGSGEEAISLARDLKPDLVLMDVRLPGINGPDATRQILADQPDTKVILVSTYERADLPDLDTCGATAFLRKQDLDAQTLLH